MYLCIDAENKRIKSFIHNLVISKTYNASFMPLKLMWLFYTE